MASAQITTYVASGLLANRPATPSVPTGGSAHYYATDESILYIWDVLAGAWDSQASTTPWDFVPPTLAILPTAVTDGVVTGATATDDADVGLILNGTSTVADNSFARLKAAPAAPFSAICNVKTLARADGHHNIGGLILRESASGRKVAFGSLANSRWGGRRATGTTLGADTSVGGDGTGTLTTDANEWFKISVDASFNLTFYISQDGKHWEQVDGETAATIGWATVDQVGVCIYVRSNSGLAMAATFKFFSAA